MTLATNTSQYIPIGVALTLSSLIAMTASQNAYTSQTPSIDGTYTESSLIKLSLETTPLPANIKKFIATQPNLSTFLNQLNPITNKIYGKPIHSSLKLWQSPIDENDTQLIITLHTGLTDDKLITEKENTLFQYLEQNAWLDSLDNVIISQEWLEV